MTIAAAGYLRVSTDEQAEHGVSLLSQKSRIIAYCQSQGWNLYDLYIDDGYSGKTLNRPAMQRLIVDAKEQKIGAVIVIKLDRLSRRQKDVLYLLEDVFEPSAVGFKSVSEPFDTTTPFGKAAIGMMAVFAQLERETIVERVREGKKEAAKQGRFMGGPIAQGYIYNHETKKLEIDAIQAEVVHFIFNEYLNSGKGYQHIADCLNERHTPSPGNAKDWGKGTIRMMLHNPFYAGLVKHKGIFHKGQHPAIITEEEFNNAQKIQIIRSSYNPKSESGLLTGIIFCGECSARMRMKKVWKNPRNPKEQVGYYVCYSQEGSSKEMIKNINCKCGYKPALSIDNAVIKYLHGYSQNQKLLKETIDKLLNSSTNNYLSKLMIQATKELDVIKKKIDKWYEAFEKNIISDDDLVKRINDLREKRYYLEQKIIECNKRIELNNNKRATTYDIIKILRNFNIIWDNSSNEEHRQILLSFIEKVSITKDNTIHIDFY
jgi:site-specific DNA recombinase